MCDFLLYLKNKPNTMGDTTNPKTKKDNNWGYILLGLLALLYVIFADDIWNASNNTFKTNNRPNSQVENRNNTSNTKNRTFSSYCSLSSTETYDYLINTRSFTLNGNGSVRFTKRYDYGRDKWTSDKMIISSGNYRLEGTWQVKGGNTITIRNYKVISGSFDASNNRPANGLLTIGCNGNLNGVLRDRNGNMIDIRINKSR